MPRRTLKGCGSQLDSPCHLGYCGLGTQRRNTGRLSIWEQLAVTMGPQTDAPGPGGTLSVICQDLGQTAMLADRIARHLVPGDVVLFDGPLAAGKTTFVTRICKALDCADQPSSPTYTISNVYTCPHFEIFHIDAYRLSGIDAFGNLGIDEFFPDSVTLIEWGTRVAGIFPQALRIEIAFCQGEDGARRLTFTSGGARWQPLLAELAGADAATDRPA